MLPQWSKRARTTGASGSGPQLTAENIARVVVEQMNATNSSQKGCNYKYFASCNPPNFDGTGGVIGTHRWLNKMEAVLNISECSDNNKVKYAACSLQNHALTWWNTQVLTMGKEIADALTWAEFRNMIIEEYCPINEIQKLRENFWNHTMVGIDIETYTTQFHEFNSALPDMCPTEQERVERYIRGLVPEIKSLMISSRLTTLKNAINMARKLTDLMISGRKLDTEMTDNKGKQVADDNDMAPRTHQSQTAGSYSMTTREQEKYLSKAPKCNRCSLRHSGSCPSCSLCGRMGHLTRSCRKNPQRTKACYICGSSNHLRRDCPEQTSN